MLALCHHGIKPHLWRRFCVPFQVTRPCTDGAPLDQSEINSELLAFLVTAPTPYHATAELCGRLASAGFEPLDSRQPWRLQPGGRYYVTRNGSALVAFTTGSGRYPERGWRMVGAHTDSPCLRLKPNALTQI